MKTRKVEYAIAETMSQYFGENLFPLFEVIKDEYIPRYKQDPLTGKILYEIKDGNRKRTRIRLFDKEEDRVTLQKINNTISGRTAFIDFHRYGSIKAKGHLKENDSVLPLQLAGDFRLYGERLQEVTDYPNLIAVVSIMKKPEDDKNDVLKLLQTLKTTGHPIAVRISINKFEEYEKMLSEYLQNSDYLMIDIDMQKISSLQPTFRIIRQSRVQGTLVLLSSPRNSNINNRDYETEGYTDLIDCSGCSEYLRLGFDGFGDFGGLKNVLPSGSGGRGGSALALLYNHNINKYLSIRNANPNIGTKGYSDVIARIMQRRAELDPDHDCPAIKIIDGLMQTNKPGNWQTWIGITLARSIHQQYKRFS
ncbi:MAG: hypothetical protein AB9828_02845 [Sphaerochaetaceae bacterium]